MGYTKTCFGVNQPESLLFKGSHSVEQLIRNEKVGGSIPLSGTIIPQVLVSQWPTSTTFYITLCKNCVTPLPFSSLHEGRSRLLPDAEQTLLLALPTELFRHSVEVGDVGVRDSLYTCKITTHYRTKIRCQHPGQSYLDFGSKALRSIDF